MVKRKGRGRALNYNLHSGGLRGGGGGGVVSTFTGSSL